MTNAFFGDSMALMLEEDDGSMEVPVAGLQGVSIMLSADHVELFTADSIERETVKKRELSIPVEIEYAKWDKSFAQWWMAGGGSSSATSVTDTSDVTTFSINTADLTSADGSVTLNVAVDNIYFEELPIWEASEGEFVSQSISGTGKTISDFSEAGTT